MPTGRVTLREENIGSVGDREFTVDILTGGTAVPIVTLGDNSGYPAVQDIYSRARRVQGGIGYFNCVNVTVRFTGVIGGGARALALNVYQEDATEFTFPWFSFFDAPEPAFAGKDPDGVRPKKTKGK
jgi:hypothetical protein